MEEIRPAVNYDTTLKPIQEEPGFVDNEPYIKKYLDQFTLDQSFLFINVPQVPLTDFEFEVARNRGYFAYPPQGLLYLAGQVSATLNVPMRIVDLNYQVLKHAQTHDKILPRDWQQHLDQAIAELGSPVIAITFMFHATNPWFEIISKYLRETYPRLCIIAGGVNATADKDRILQDKFADVVVSNEGEFALKNMLLYGSGKKETSLFNISVCNEKNEVVSTKMFNGGEVEYDISDQYDLIKIDDYHNVGSLSVYSRMMGIEVPFATVIAKRGCRAHCTFCGVRNFNGRGVRPRDPGTIVDEMKLLRKKNNIRHFDWLDDDLLFDREKTLSLFKRIADELPDVTWAANNGLIPAALNRELLDEMARSHCMGFKIGLESGNPEILKKVNKPINLRKLADFSKMMKDYPSMFVSTNIILGLPEETFGQMLDSFLVSITIKLDWANYYIYQPLRNTEAFKAFGGLSDDNGLKLSHGKDNIGPIADRQLINLNPVRGKAFESNLNSGMRAGYDIFGYAPDYTPTRKELSEVWFAFNTITNFFLMPALYSDRLARKKNGVQFLNALINGYPGDPLMKLSLANLLERSENPDAEAIDRLRKQARAIFDASHYWSKRAEQFNLFELFTQITPKLPSHIQEMIDRYEIKTG